MKNARAKRAKAIVFHCQICKFVTFILVAVVVVVGWLSSLLSYQTVKSASKVCRALYRIVICHTIYHLHLRCLSF